MGAERYHMYRIVTLFDGSNYIPYMGIFLGVYLFPLVQGAWEFGVIPTTFCRNPNTAGY